MAEDLAKFKLQFQQVEAALLGDPENDELQKLKSDLTEMISLQEELVEAERKEEESKDQIPQQAKLWKVGDRVIAPLPTGKTAVAVIDNFTAAGYAITFIASGQKTIVDPTDLVPAPSSSGGKQKTNYVFDKRKMDKDARQAWQAERDKRRLKAQKKEARRKELDSVAEAEKNDWVKFNNKASRKGLAGLKKVTATNTSRDTGAKGGSLVSSRSNDFSFKSTRGNMDSMF